MHSITLWIYVTIRLFHTFSFAGFKNYEEIQFYHNPLDFGEISVSIQNDYCSNKTKLSDKLVMARLGP